MNENVQKRDKKAENAIVSYGCVKARKLENEKEIRDGVSEADEKSWRSHTGQRCKKQLALSFNYAL